MITIPLLVSQDHHCSYFAERTAKSAFVHPSFALTPVIYSQLLALGYRRSGNEVYRPHCADCKDCIAARVPVHDFKPSRNQKRISLKNRDVAVNIKPADFEQTHYLLYKNYQQSRHSGGTMENSSPEDYMNFLSSDWCNTLFVEFTINDELAAVAIIDQLPDALSAVYTFFAPPFSQYSLGKYAILWEFDYAQHLNLEWLYLGFWLKDCQKMSYKNQFRPLQLFIDNQWQQYDKHQEI